MKHEFSLRAEKILHISEIKSGERGKACNCICPYCKEALVAKKGKENVHHFAHSVLECDPRKAFESAIHLLAKDILIEKQYIRVPSLYFLYLISYRLSEIRESVFDLEKETREDCIIELQHIGEQEADEMTMKVIDEQTISFKEIVTEVRINDFIPDVLIKSNGGIPLAIEIAVTHFIDDTKKNKIEEANLATVEIDLSDWVKKDSTSFKRNDLEDAIVHSINNKRWIYSSKIKGLKEKFLQEIYEILQKEDKDEKRAREEEKQRENRIAEIIEQRKALTPLCHKKNLIQYKEALKTDMRIRTLLWELGVNKKTDKKINCCNVYIPGEQVFDCDRRLWQTYAFYHILKEVREVNVGNLMNYLKNELDSCIEPTLSTRFYRRDIPTLADVVRTYMFHLYQFEVIAPKVYSKGQKNKLQIHTPSSDYMWGNFKSLYHNVMDIPLKAEYPCVHCGEVTTKWECMISYRSCLCKSCFNQVGIPK